MNTKPTEMDLLGDMLLKELEYRHNGYHPNSRSSRRFRELLWDIHRILGKETKMSVEFENGLRLGKESIPKPFTGEHKKPVNELLDDMLKKYKDYHSIFFENETDDLIGELFDYLQDNLEVVHITKEEDERLNRRGLKISSPLFEKDRYEVANIQISNARIFKDGMMAIIIKEDSQEVLRT
jgi:hypothetical protein